MNLQAHPDDLTASLGPLGRRFAGLALGAGILGLGVAVAVAALTPGSYRRFMLAYVVAFAFVLSLALGGMFFVFIQHVTRSGWSVVVRRLAEALMINVVLVALMFIPIAVAVVQGHGSLYSWTQRDIPNQESQGAGPPSQAGSAAVNPHPSVGHAERAFSSAKQAYLSAPAFIGRWIVYLGLWSLIAWFFRRHSVRQDTEGDYRHTQRMEAVAGPVGVVFGITVTFAAFDLVMSLAPHWFSTIFGVYFFAGSVVASLALMILMLVRLQGHGLLKQVNVEHQHDLGKLLFCFVFFWGYIAFSQYMLIWYGNMPDERVWLVARGASTAAGVANGWSTILLILLFGHFLLPFAGLLSRHAKRRRALLTGWAVWLLLMQWLDLLWLVMPSMGPKLHLGVIEIGLGVGLGGLFMAGVWRSLGQCRLLPVHDPRLQESLAFENI